MDPSGLIETAGHLRLSARRRTVKLTAEPTHNDDPFFERRQSFLPANLTNNRFPIARLLDPSLDAVDLFHALASLPGRVWLDSATARTAGDGDQLADQTLRRLSRYSFLTADPIHQLVAFSGQSDPWDELARLCGSLPSDHDPSLPPFQGGMIGVLGYESSRWLEPIELAHGHQHQSDDLPTPAMSFGVYDFTIAMDHVANQNWLICQGFTAADLRSPGATSPAQRARNAHERAAQICELLSDHAANRSDEPVEVPIGLSGAFQQTISRDAVSSNFTSEQFRASVAEIVDRIRNGDSFQVNLAQRLTTAATLDPASLYLRLRQSNPAPFAGFYDGGTFQVLSSSPEGFLQLRDRHVATRPIKGTVPRTGDDETDDRLAEGLLASQKDRSENIMIVDLMRNDLSRVCRDESVLVSQMCEIERYEFVQHLVSVVEGDLCDGVDAVDLLKACFPGGSVTGAPKIEAMKTIAELESHPRGPYCGSMGYLGCGGDADFNILIRTITSSDGQLQIPVGGGITARSEPASEEAETWAKATGMLNALPHESARNPPATRHAANPDISGVV